jgi:hypothetical protein
VDVETIEKLRRAGLVEPGGRVEAFCDGFQRPSISMRSFVVARRPIPVARPERAGKTNHRDDTGPRTSVRV